MSKIVWDEIGKRFYETGVSKGVLFPVVKGAYSKGVPWNGLISVSQNPEGAEPNPFYADNIKYLNLPSVEEFNGNINAYTYPDEFKPCIGEKEIAPGVTISQQTRTEFGFSYQTILGNDTEKNAYGYKIHLVYGALAAVAEKEYSTVNDSPEPAELSWEFSTTPVAVEGCSPTAHLEIDSTKVDANERLILNVRIWPGSDLISNEDQGKNVNLEFYVK